MKRSFVRGSHNPILRGLTITMVINHVSESWDDPPSISPSQAPFHQLPGSSVVCHFCCLGVARIVPKKEFRINGDRINGLFHLLINGTWHILGLFSPTDPITFDPNFQPNNQVWAPYESSKTPRSSLGLALPGPARSRWISW